MRYRSKAEWAAAKAQTLHLEAEALRLQHIPSSNWRAVQGKARALSAIRAEALRFERMARRFREAA